MYNSLTFSLNQYFLDSKMNQPGFVVCTLQTPTQDISWTSLAAHVAITPLANRLRWQLALKLANTNDYTIINQIASTCVRNSEKIVGFFVVQKQNMGWDSVGSGCQKEQKA